MNFTDCWESDITMPVLPESAGLSGSARKATVHAWCVAVLVFFVLFLAGGVAHGFVHHHGHEDCHEHGDGGGAEESHRCEFEAVAAQPALAPSSGLAVLTWLSSLASPVAGDAPSATPPAVARRGRAPPGATA